jgi:hypothetical protein
MNSSSSALYMPILKWRAKNRLALSGIPEEMKRAVLPLYEVPLGPWNFDYGNAVTMTAGLKSFRTDLDRCWPDRPCVVDFPYAGYATEGGADMAQSVLDACLDHRDTLMFAFTLDRTREYLEFVKHAVHRGFDVCLRLRAHDLTPQLKTNVDQYMSALAVTRDRCVVMVDFEGDVPPSAGDYALLIQNSLVSIATQDPWKAFVVAGTSIPAATPSHQYRSGQKVPRPELAAFVKSRDYLDLTGTHLIFSDYATSHPTSEMVDPRLLGRGELLFFATDDEWEIFVPRSFSSDDADSAWSRHMEKFLRGTQLHCRDVLEDVDVLVSPTASTSQFVDPIWAQLEVSLHIESTLSSLLRKDRPFSFDQIDVRADSAREPVFYERRRVDRRRCR